MADRSILFGPPMVRATLREVAAPGSGKTQRRHVLKIKGHKSFSELKRSDTNGYDWTFRDSGMRWHDLTDAELKTRLRLAVGDRLWLREAWRAWGEYNDTPPSQIPQDSGIQYDADANLSPWVSKYRPGMFMPRWASRLTLLVTDVRMQRLQDISESDARAEGLEWVAPQYGISGIQSTWNADPVAAYAALWNSINGPDAWAANPWVCAITFKPMVVNIDHCETQNG